jgi:hypothetical protein
MADKSMKSVIWAEMDTTGITRGVAKTTAELTKLNRTAASGARSAGITATLQMTQAAFQGVGTLFGNVERRMNELNAAALKFSGPAMGANMMANAERLKADISIAKSVTPGSIAMSKTKEDLAAGEAARIERQAGGINAGMGSVGRARGNLGATSDMLLEMGGTWFSGIEKLFSGDIQGVMDTRSQLMGQAGELVNAQNYAYQAPTPGRGMAGSEEYLRQIANSLKSGAQ